MRDDSALGLLETRGLIAAVEGADAMLKASEVRLVRIEQTDAALMTVQVVGEVAAVRSAVDAGRAAAERVGIVISAHVIPRPDAAVRQMLMPDERRHTTAPAPSAAQTEPPAPTAPATGTLASRTVSELRALARDIADFPLQGRAISRARKQELVRLLRPFLGARRV